MSRQGDLASELQPGRSITTVQWALLAEALQLAAKGWQPPDVHGTSYPVKDPALRAEAIGFLDTTVAIMSLDDAKVARGSSRSGLVLRPRTLANFLLLRAAHALADPVPMRR